MVKTKKPFINRKRAASFRLLHRSQRDPLIADESAGERVLHPAVDSKELEERRKYGVYYKDDYDYLQHLKTVGEAIDVVGAEPVEEQELIRTDNPHNRLPSCIFETRGVELKVGMLNRAAPTNELLPNIDPDVAAALDSEELEPTILTGEEKEDEENVDGLEDDFVQKANGEEPLEGVDSLAEMRDEEKGRAEMLQRFGLRTQKSEKFSDESSGDESESDDDGMSDSPPPSVEGRKSKFTNYSMSSAVIKRPDGLRHIDDHFETLYAEQYAASDGSDADGEELGDGAELPDGLRTDSKRFQELLEEQNSVQRRFAREPPDAALRESVLRSADRMDGKGGGDGAAERTEHILVAADGAKRGRWDCESVLSTYSTLYNHPTEIREPGKRKHNGLTKAGLKGLEKMDTAEEEEVRSTHTRTSMASSFRPKDETPEERRVRKQAVREERRERRKEKAVNKEAFREERIRMAAEAAKRNAQKTRPIH